jgi:hypothetical protein
MLLNAPENEPLTLRMINCTVTPKKGCENIALIEGKNLKEIDLTNTKLLGFTDPKIN